MEAVYDSATGLYRCGELAVSAGLTENLLGRAYFRLEDDKTLSTVYYENIPSVSKHIQWMSAPDAVIQGAFVETKAKAFDFCGLSWVINREQLGIGLAKAEVGFSFFRHSCHPSQKLRLGEMMLDGLFGRYAIDVLIGTTPVCNRLALRYSRALGFTLSGPIPDYVSWEGALEGVMVSTLTKTTWAAMRRASAAKAALRQSELCLHPTSDVDSQEAA